MSSDIFCLTDSGGNLLNPAVQATVLAKYSRSEESARTLLSTISSDEANKFHDKWVISYGHSSVAELATIPICFEGVSMIASKFIESFQRAGYSEKSTRYQRFSSSSFVLPSGLPQNSREFVNRFYSAYESMIPDAEAIAVKAFGLDDNEKNRKLPKVKARAFDMLRGILPAGTGTNLAAVMNLRDVRYLIQQARGHINSEIRDIGEKVFLAASQIAPTLVKDAEPDLFEPRVKSLGHNHMNPKDPVVLLKYDDNATQSVRSAVSDIYGMTWEDFELHMSSRGNRAVPSVFKIPNYSFLVTMDYGSFRDLQRHRRCDQFVELLTPYLGYDIPDDIVGTRIESQYTRVMDSLHSFDFDSIDPNYLQYMIPMGYKHRTIFKMDLKELYYIVELRTRPQGHIDYRRVAYKMYETAKSVHPELMKWCQAIYPSAIGEHR